MRLRSSAFEANGSIPSQYTCDGSNTSPPLTISGVPPAAASLVLIMDDPDVPATIRPDGVWDHWIVFNMPPDTTDIPPALEPAGTPGTGTSGATGYHGPCPPDREHRYMFKLYALDATLDLPAGATKADIETAMAGHIIAQTELIGRYQRQQ